MQEYGLSLICILPYKNRIYHSVFIRENTGQRKPVFSQILCRVGLCLSKVSKQHLVFGHFWLFSQNNQPTLDWKFKNDWTKRLQRSLKNVSLSLAKRKLAEKNEWKFFNQSGESCTLPHTSQIKVESFLWLHYLENDFMIASLVRLNIGDVPVTYLWWSAYQ